MKIVSANYRDRSSKQRWLMRDVDQDPRKAKAHKGIIATRVTFQPAEVYELGFGCSMVAFCETAEPADDVGKPGPDEVRLRFDVIQFVDPNGNVVSACSKLRLGADGSMYATIEKETEQPAAEEPAARVSSV